MSQWPKELSKHFTEEEIQMVKKYMKKSSTFLTIGEMQIKTTLRFHLTPVRTAVIKTTSQNKCW